MKKSLAIFCVLFSILLMSGIAHAASINLYVDAAPNVYGSSDFAAWKTSAYGSAVNGTFVNMQNSYNAANSGTTNFEINDCVVYSFGDLGARLHFVYWLPNETIASLTNKGFQLSVSSIWDGAAYTYADWYTPTSWEERDGGVIGTYGFAWWGAYGVNTPEALAADLANWDLYQGDVTIQIRYSDGNASLTAHHIPAPEPATMLLLGFGLMGLIGIRKKL